MLTLNKQNISIFIIWLFSISAILGIYLGHLNWFITKTPLNLLLGAVLLFWNLPINTFRKIIVWVTVFCLGMLVEILGVQTGTIFGEYYYGSNLGAKFMGVPYLIGVNWAVLAFITAGIGKRLTDHFFLALFIGASLMVLLDLFLEPMAAIFDFWHFKNGVVPIQNYLAWFLIALLFQFFIRKTMAIQSTNFSIHLFLSQVAFFALCYLMLA